MKCIKNDKEMKEYIEHTFFPCPIVRPLIEGYTIRMLCGLSFVQEVSCVYSNMVPLL